MAEQEEKKSPKLTGISEITGKVVRVRHAEDADMVFIEGKLRELHMDTGDIEKGEFVVALENDEIIGFGRQKAIGEAGQESCILVFDRKKRGGVTELILKHLLEYSPATTIYAVTDQKEPFLKVGFKEHPKELEDELDIACRVTEGSTVMVLNREEARWNLEEGMELFNARKYFEAHEAWERPWLRAKKDSPERLFIQGLIMVSGALDHYRKKEYAGTEKLMDKALDRLERHKALGMGLDVEEFLRQVRAFYDRFKAAREGIPESDFPKLRKLPAR